jgi:hypothetical protein
VCVCVLQVFHRHPHPKIATFSLSETLLWLPITAIADWGFNLLLFRRGVFVQNPDPISMANNGAHEGPSPLVRPNQPTPMHSREISSNINVHPSFR